MVLSEPASRGGMVPAAGSFCCPGATPKSSCRDAGRAAATLVYRPGRHDISACREPRLLRVAAAEVRVEYLLLFDRCLGRGETRGEQTER